MEVRLAGVDGVGCAGVEATDAAGNVQPLEQPWNQHGFANNEVQRVPVVVGGGEAADEEQ
jgi:hypothetical protein